MLQFFLFTVTVAFQGFSIPCVRPENFARPPEFLIKKNCCNFYISARAHWLRSGGAAEPICENLNSKHTQAFGGGGGAVGREFRWKVPWNSYLGHVPLEGERKEGKERGGECGEEKGEREDRGRVEGRGGGGGVRDPMSWTISGSDTLRVTSCYYDSVSLPVDRGDDGLWRAGGVCCFVVCPFFARCANDPTQK